MKLKHQVLNIALKNYGYIPIDITIAFTLNRLRYESKTIGTKYRKHSNWWRWWESNPRPRAFPKDFLRAQPIAFDSLTLRQRGKLGASLSRGYSYATGRSRKRSLHA